MPDRLSWLYIYRTQRGTHRACISYDEPRRTAAGDTRPVWSGAIPPHMRNRSLDELRDWWAIERELGAIA